MHYLYFIYKPKVKSKFLGEHVKMLKILKRKKHEKANITLKKKL